MLAVPRRQLLVLVVLLLFLSQELQRWYATLRALVALADGASLDVHEALLHLPVLELELLLNQLFLALSDCLEIDPGLLVDG